MLTPHRPPPEDYYQNNCVTLLQFVAQHYQLALSRPAELAINQYLAASSDAQRLLARILSRKGPYFKSTSLDYPEVLDAQLARDELVARGLIVVQPSAPLDQLLHLLTKKEILSIFSDTNPRDSKANLVSENQFSEPTSR